MMKFRIHAVLGAAALLCASAAQAVVVDFESVDTTNAPYAPLLADGDYVTQKGYFVNTQDVNRGGGLIGQLSNGADPTSCLNGTCPAGNASSFLSVYNDGVVHVGRLSGASTLFSSIDAAYIPVQGATGTSIYLAIEADSNGSEVGTFAYKLSGTSVFQTITANTAGIRLGSATGSLTASNVTDLFFFALYCDGVSGNCSAFQSNRAQFAVDNITLDVPAVPEPAEWALMTVGLGAVATFARRRRPV